jgi:hypothetical protein
MDKEIIRDRLQTVQVDITNTRTDLFSTVPESKMRYVVAIFIFGDGVSSRLVNIEKVEEAGTYTSKFKNVPVSPAERVSIPTRFSIEDPIIVCEGGTKLVGSVTTSATIPVTVVYWDSDI